MNKLLEMNVPAAISILHGGKIHHFGSKYTKEFLKSHPELKQEMEKDNISSLLLSARVTRPSAAKFLE